MISPSGKAFSDHHRVLEPHSQTMQPRSVPLDEPSTGRQIYVVDVKLLLWAQR